ncbi:PREDICTED: non-specific lipid transfer protein-like 1 [Nelumbo nucifera]|uniref:Bifunctional inhibitor/plant lipid transfer protein/seed storage helical domain-containing protein n=2 Tax=Nelumbo nucifera TaxID=4432 RepID=A0A822XL95_NELNU|nr:PREDICTED: non-specific lipid transfer protein-like 1 [Nelumbo nucifera]DAD19595.1 TPA_asm: hypothetical protein HUJ06_021058 [Nelumbo nucifera]
MEGLKVSRRLMAAVLSMILATSMMPADGQVVSPCTNAMVSSFTPCFNYITGSSANGSSPTADCCGSLRSLMSTSMDCACLILTGNVPFQIPFTRNLAMSLPKACKMSGVSVQCKSSASPLPAPGPATLGIPPPRQAPPSPSPRASLIPALSSPPPALPPEIDITVASEPALPPVDTATPTLIPGSRPVLTPSAAKPAYIFSPSLFLFVLGVMVLNYH